jgi:hypothetical protein
MPHVQVNAYTVPGDRWAVNVRHRGDEPDASWEFLGKAEPLYRVAEHAGPEECVVMLARALEGMGWDLTHPLSPTERVFDQMAAE